MYLRSTKTALYVTGNFILVCAYMQKIFVRRSISGPFSGLQKEWAPKKCIYQSSALILCSRVLYGAAWDVLRQWDLNGRSLMSFRMIFPSLHLKPVERRLVNLLFLRKAYV